MLNIDSYVFLSPELWACGQIIYRSFGENVDFLLVLATKDAVEIQIN